MTAVSVGDIRAALAVVVEHLGSARQHAGLAQTRLAAAHEQLHALAEQTSRPVVPAELTRAVDRLDDVTALLAGTADTVADLSARL